MFSFSESIRDIIDTCQQAGMKKKHFLEGEKVLDNDNENPYLYLFIDGTYTVEFSLYTGWTHEVGEISGPDIMGESILLGEHHKPVRITTKKPGNAYMITTNDISRISEQFPTFEKNLLTLCIATGNHRVREANTERTVLYLLSEYFKEHSHDSVFSLLLLLRETFRAEDIIWVERHQILEDVFAIRYAVSEGNTPINERIDMQIFHTNFEVCTRNFPHGKKCSHLFPLELHGRIYGYLIFSEDKKYEIPHYVKHILAHLAPLFVQVIEEEWKKHTYPSSR